MAIIIFSKARKAACVLRVGGGRDTGKGDVTGRGGGGVRERFVLVDLISYHS